MSLLQIEIFNASIASWQPSAAKVDATEQQMGLVVVRREVHGALKLGDRLSITLRLVGPTCRLEMKGGKLALIALAGRTDDVLDPQDIRQAKIHSQAFEAARHRRCRGFHLPLCIDGRQPPREIPFAGRLSGAANRAKRDTKDEVGGMIGWIAAHGFSQPPHGGRPVTIQPVGVAKIEERIDPVEAGRLVEVRHGARALAILRPAKLHDTQVVEERGVALLSVQPRQLVERLLIALQLEERHRRQETRLPGKPWSDGHLPDCSQGPLVLAEIVVNIPRREACSLQLRARVEVPR